RALRERSSTFVDPDGVHAGDAGGIERTRERAHRTLNYTGRDLTSSGSGPTTSSVRDVPQLLHRRMVPGDSELVGRGGVERLGHEVEERAGIRQRPVAVRDSGGDPDENVLPAARDDRLRPAERSRALPHVVEHDL